MRVLLSGVQAALGCLNASFPIVDSFFAYPIGTQGG